MRREDAGGNGLAGLVIGALLSAPVWLAVWWLIRFMFG